MKSDRNKEIKGNMRNIQGMEVQRFAAGAVISLEEFSKAVGEMMACLYEECEIILRRVPKNNGRYLMGLFVRENGQALIPCIYLDDYYEEYQRGVSLYSIGNAVADIFEKSRNLQCVHNEVFSDFQQVKRNICLKLINLEKNREQLEGVPYRTFHDLAVVYSLILHMNKDGVTSVMIDNRLLEIWGVNESTIHLWAKENTLKLLGWSVMPISTVVDPLSDECTEDADSSDEMEDFFVATNALKSDGAALLLYDNVLQAFSDQIKKDYYIIPSSVDELMFIPDNEIIEPEILRDCLCDSNKKTLPSEKILSEHIYHYSRSSGTLTML